MDYKLVCILLVLLILTGCVSRPNVIIFTSSSKVYVNVEIADTEEKRRTGLMYRDYLDENSGMLFVFEEEQHVTFWMKNTKLPLDMVFISANGTISEIKENIQPCVEDPCPVYPSEHPVKYVLEVNAGFCRSNNITVGDVARIVA
jgi:uncharacterized membrane protein (UPF0127 family)